MREYTDPRRAVRELIAMETRICALIASVNGYVTKAEADELDRLHRETGLTYDPIGRRFHPYEPEND